MYASEAAWIEILTNLEKSQPHRTHSLTHTCPRCKSTVFTQGTCNSIIVLVMGDATTTTVQVVIVWPWHMRLPETDCRPSLKLWSVCPPSLTWIGNSAAHFSSSAVGGGRDQVQVDGVELVLEAPQRLQHEAPLRALRHEAQRVVPAQRRRLREARRLPERRVIARRWSGS